MTMHSISGKYKVTYKSPRISVDRRNRATENKIYTFEGICENFSTHLSAFLNDKDQLLLVDYEDIIQLQPLD